MNREEAIKVLSTYDMSEDNEDKEFIEAIKMAISALSAEGEYIKKEDALNDRKIYALWNGSEFVYVVNADYLKSLPTYSFPDREDYDKLMTINQQLAFENEELRERFDSFPDREKGEWITKYEHKMCNKCGHTPPSDDDHYYILSNFCPNCGADMRGKANE